MDFTNLEKEGLTRLEEAKKYISDDKGWENRGVFHDVLMESKEFKDKSSVPCYRFSTKSKKSIDELIKEPWELSEEVLKVDEPSVGRWKKLDQNQKGDCKVMEMLTHMPWPLWSREIVIAQLLVKEKDANWVVSWSTMNDKVPIKPKENVRAQVHVSVYAFMKDVEGSKMYRLSLVDPGGLIPVSIVDLFAKKQLKPLVKWRG